MGYQTELLKWLQMVLDWGERNLCFAGMECVVAWLKTKILCYCCTSNIILVWLQVNRSQVGGCAPEHYSHALRCNMAGPFQICFLRACVCLIAPKSPSLSWISSKSVLLQHNVFLQCLTLHQLCSLLLSDSLPMGMGLIDSAGIKSRLLSWFSSKPV